jgi:crotonobetainyl-CoA:carnitine CoA-transferase CaiB-like acyl-CoA transferase
MTGTRTAPPPLAGIKVLDFSRVFAGPYATMMLADLGADVVKVEPPTGDEARYFGPPFLAGEGMNYLAVNRNKRGIVLDLKQPGAVEVAHRMAAGADVVMENFRPGVADRLGIGYAELSATNPGLVYCSISGFGAESPWADRPAVDPVLQAMGGLMEKQGHGIRPEWVCVAIADTFAASLATQGILAALLARGRDDGRGQRVEISLYEALVAAQGYRMVSGLERVELPAWDDTVPNGAFRGSDGRWLVLTVATARNWAALCAALGRPDMVADARFATNALRVEHKGELMPQLEAAFATRPAAAWLASLGEAGVPSGPVRAVEEVITDESLERSGVIVRSDHALAGTIRTMGSALHLDRTPVRAVGATPVLGQHTREVLAELGLDEAAADALFETGAVR